MKIQNPYIGLDGYHCFGCAPTNPAGLHMEFRYENSCVIAEWQPDMNFAGYADVLHGGIQAALADETAAWLVMIELDTAGMTSELSIRYFRPLHISGAVISICASLVNHRKSRARVQVSLADSKGNICSLAELSFSIFPPGLARKKLQFPGREAFLGA
ncbi:MAG: PaaI family thioesterase [Spirochaetales bacterium]|nr:PaaI family thioesterase [Spirochaetales bacterium]